LVCLSSLRARLVVFATPASLMPSGVTHTVETYEGDHTNRVIERIVLPFFSDSLSFSAQKK
jgi:hypothetical protein